MLTEGNGVPLATTLTGANRHDVTQLVALVEAVPPVRGRPGPPRRLPERVQGDRAYDSEAHRGALKKKWIKSEMARRGAPHGSGLGRTRWVVERTLAWQSRYRKLRTRDERHPSTHEALIRLANALICLRTLSRS